MKGQSGWSYSPYRPFLTETGDLYVCRIAPTENSIHIEWLDTKEDEYNVFVRRRGAEFFDMAGKTRANEFDITGLDRETDYEFFVSSKCGKSLIRLARCGVSVGTTVNYLHPDDTAYSFSGRYLCSPSLLRLPDGILLASMDVYAPGAPQNLTLIFRSEDNGETWHYSCELMPCFWGKMFLHNRKIYMLACSTEYGDLLIGCSEDGGRSFSSPVTLLRGSNGKDGNVGVHKNPQNIIRYNGRIYETLEWGSWKNKEYYHAAMVMSCNEDDDLLSPESWHFTPPLKYDSRWEGTAPDGEKGCIEGTLCIDKDGRLMNLMRYQTEEKKILAFCVNKSDADAPLSFSHAIDFPANLSKFMIKFDTVSGKYYSLASKRIDSPKTRRNLLSLLSSPDLEKWDTVCDIIDKRYDDLNKIGFQYVDFEIEGDDIIFLCRTAINGAHSFHDSNYSTFHRIKNFRSL